MTDLTAEVDFDAIVVGSGFGGSVMACRLAEAGMRVCLLERGMAYPPGSFPRSPHRLRENVWDPADGRLGMFELWSFRHIDAFVASGLGGGSLIYANVMLRMDEHWFVTEDVRTGVAEPWPISRADLDPHYDRVAAMLGATPYPIDAGLYRDTPKTHAFFAAARQIGLQPFLPDLAVTFANEGDPPIPGEPIREAQPNLHGRTRTTCRMCGECDIGCNFGSKNTLDYTYLSAASRRGADLRTGCEVVELEPGANGGYTVRYLHRERGNGDTPPPPATVTLTSERLILSAGSLGSTSLLLRNRSRLPGLSPALGTRFSGNGDVLTMAVDATHVVNGRVVPLAIEPGRGPVITSAIRVDDAHDGGEGRGFYLEDGGLPELLGWLIHGVDTPGPVLRALVRTVWRTLLHRPRSQISGELADVFGSESRAARILPLLGMGREVPDGRVVLRDDQLDVEWSPDTSREYFRRVRDTARDVAHALGARAIDNPTWLLGKLVTVHPLGGCPMATGPGTGVVNAEGEVFGHPGLYVVDGSILPGPIGANPSMTIAAIAERAAERLLEGRRRAAREASAVG